MTLEIARSERCGQGEYRIELPGVAQPALLTWRARGDARVIEHTYVPTEMRGRGIAQQLVEAIVADARAEGFGIVPQCSYAEALFRRHPEWADLLAG